MIAENKEIDRYDDVEVIGQWAVLDTSTGEITRGGDMIGQTVKIQKPDGEIFLDRDWFPE